LTASLQQLDAIAERSTDTPRKVRGNGRAKRRALAVKYRNPSNPKETWAGRGLKARWLVAAVKGGKKKLADFAVDRKAH
jgi:DNA-binding protein H-NS